MTIAKILIVEDDSKLQEALVDTLELNKFEVVAVSSAQDALVALDDEIAMVFSDIRMDGSMDGYELMKRIRAIKPYLPIVLMTAYGTVEQAVEAMKAGAVDYILKPFEADILVEKAKAYFYRDASSTEDFVTADPAMIQLKAMAQKVADSEASVMISGESGTGKEVLARFIHNNSKRKDQPFIAINCAAIPENMLEATLFGYEKGSFTGALKSMPGKFEQAQGGTIFLDEIGEMKADLQAKLLRVLQEREVERIGGLKSVDLDVRVLSATNVDMKKAIMNGDFREDLFYRLNVFPIKLPSLKERPKDIAAIAERLLQRHCGNSRVEPMMSAPAMKALLQYPWPGNIRELDNVIQRALVVMSGNTIHENDILLDDVPRYAPAAPEETSEAPKTVSMQEASEMDDMLESEPMSMDLKEREVQLILETLKANDGHRQKTAEALNISPRTLRYKLARFKEQGLEVM
ncbi:sigma-54-dependent transcriptional regulator [Hydrogenovibrio marinus]|uniref:Fis family transcriptional regulator n=1 Tax=Hydrogenovibrio marinus TaxID=28885 RepID=A0A066ZYH4_HYDMR|nr:sigma-54 dependent transcriptional regulator [Hydrogenovibrio marinus]KDN95406.1 Fis family transcriptional regulator [Hydrogenovibrio marinus]BBN59895.1 sigma-54-dependent Fis family transcriptional regulator [Hydrogenovibrio marinus]